MSLPVLTMIGLVVLAALVVLFIRTRSNDQIEALVNKHKSGAKVATKAELIEGMNHIPVAIVMNGGEIQYENLDLQAKLEIARIDEVEYDNELATGTHVNSGRVLRLRSHGHAFEFILDSAAAERWATVLPAHRMNEPGSVVAH